MGAVLVSHVHAWQIAEVEFVDCQTVHRLECACGATEFVFVA